MYPPPGRRGGSRGRRMTPDCAHQPYPDTLQPDGTRGLYDPAHEHDACGVGFVVDIKGRKSHEIVKKALQVLKNLQHRGACGCEVNTGDGAGILVQMPDAFLRTVTPVDLPPVGQYGAGLVFLPKETTHREA